LTVVGVAELKTLLLLLTVEANGSVDAEVLEVSAQTELKLVGVLETDLLAEPAQAGKTVVDGLSVDADSGANGVKAAEAVEILASKIDGDLADVDKAGNINIAGSINSKWLGNINVHGDLNGALDDVFNLNWDLNRDLNRVGLGNLSGNLDSNLHLSGDLDGDGHVNWDLDNLGNGDINVHGDIDGNLHLSRDLHLSGHVNVHGNLNLTGNLSLDIDGDGNLNGDALLELDGHLSGDGHLDVV
jgi:hypothetical protein